MAKPIHLQMPGRNTTPPTDQPPPAALDVLFAAPHRPMFLAGTVQALAVMVFWGLELGGRYLGLWPVPPWPLLTVFPPPVLHALLLSCGMFPFFMFGFILTAGPRWQGAGELSQRIDGVRKEGVEIAMSAVRLEWKKVKKAGWQEVEVDKEECKVTSGKDPVVCKFLPKSGGRHKIVAVVSDKEGRKNQTTLSVWVPGGNQPKDRNLEQESVTLIPNKKSWQPGETAEVLVQASFSPAEGLYIISRGGLVEAVPFKVEKHAVTLKIPIAEWMIPGVDLKVFLNGMADRVGDDGKPNPKLPKRPAFASGGLSLEVPPTMRTLTVAAVPKHPLLWQSQGLPR